MSTTKEKEKSQFPVRPLGGNVLIKPLDAEETTKAGLVIPDTAKEKPQEGVVVAVGPGEREAGHHHRIPLDIAVGNVVIYRKYGGTEVKHDSVEYLLLAARDVLAIVEKAK